MDARTAAKTPRKLAQAGMAAGLRSSKATEMTIVASAWSRQMPVTTSAVRYVGPLGDVETGVMGSVGDVALGK